MVLENSQESLVQASTDGNFPSFSYSLPQLAGITLVIAAAAFGAIRVRKIVLPFSYDESVPSKTSSIGSAHHYETTKLTTICRRFCTGLTRLCQKNRCRNSLRKVPQRLRNFYINTFLIPSYRKEWEKYRTWSHQAPRRPPKSSKLKCQLRTVKKGQTNNARDKTHPIPVPHNHALCQHVRINVSGCIYETQLRTLNRYPDTLLGNPNRRIQFYVPQTDEYFFDRNRQSFETILYYYQSGGYLKRPDIVSADILLNDMKFYGLPQSTIFQFLCEEGLSALSTDHEDTLPKNLLQRKIWLLFEYPQSSLQAQGLSLISVTAIVLSISTLIIETLEMFANNEEKERLIDPSPSQVQFGDFGHLKETFELVESICNMWFLVEYLARLATCPVKSEFISNKLNIIDIAAVLPWFLEHLNPHAPKKETFVTFAVIKIVRLVRVFRIFKLSRHSHGLKILGKTLHASLHELMLLVFFIAIGVVLFASAIYFAEKEIPNTTYQSIPAGFWWAVITITTVGYGGENPETLVGRVIGSLCAVVGVLTLALPVPIIVSNFNFFYHQELGDSDLSWLIVRHTPQCPFRPMDAGGEVPSQPDQKGHSSYRKKRVRVLSPNAKRPEDPDSSDEDFRALKKPFARLR